jgi:predicted kinase
MNGVRPRLVLVTGAPASGKTTLADRLGPALCLPVLSRDRLKALLADALPEPAAADMALLRQTHVTLFFDLVADLLASGPGLVAESALDVSLAPNDLRAALARADAVHVHCHVTPALSVWRFSERAPRDERHRAHDDRATWTSSRVMPRPGTATASRHRSAYPCSASTRPLATRRRSRRSWRSPPEPDVEFRFVSDSKQKPLSRARGRG